MRQTEQRKGRTGGHTCPPWFLFTFDNPLRRRIHNPDKILRPYISPGDTVLDVGCGMGAFTIDLANYVGPQGKVIAADLQEAMLDGLEKRAARAGLSERIQRLQCGPEQIGLADRLDFALAFWMVHEVHQPAAFLQEIYQWLKPGGQFLIAEPRLHVSGKAFARSMSLAKSAGFVQLDQPHVRASRAALLGK